MSAAAFFFGAAAIASYLRASAAAETETGGTRSQCAQMASYRGRVISSSTYSQVQPKASIRAQ